jgi:RNA polymerase sigma-70 factor (ECF subfamily)
MNTLEQEFMDNYDENASHILKHIYYRVSDWELARDLTQETFFKTWNHIASRGKKIDNLKTFTYRIAHNLIVDHYRRKPRIPLSLEAVDTDKIYSEPVQEKEIDRAIDEKLLKKKLSSMEEPYRQIIIHRYLNDLSIKEISIITGKSENNISVMIHRAIKILKNKYTLTLAGECAATADENTEI